MLHSFLRRESPTLARVEHPTLDIRLFANECVAIEPEAIEQLLAFTDIVRAISDLKNSGDPHARSYLPDAAVHRIVLTPDFHRGSGIPVGTVIETENLVIPKAVGNDICCGMRLVVLDLPADSLDAHWPAIQKRLRAIFFQGERDIPMSPRQREAVLRDGLPGMLSTWGDNENRGLWTRSSAERLEDELARVHQNGRIPTRRLFGFDKFIASSGKVDGRDPQIGCVGGGNHFVELQRVESLLDGAVSRNWGIAKGNVAIMAHSGSVGLGHAIGGYFMERAQKIFPKSLKAPSGDFFPLPLKGPLADEGQFYLDAMGNAANFAFANRFFLTLMAIRAIEEVLGKRVDYHLVWDAPHNLVFPYLDHHVHRKGATPADGPSRNDEWLGNPVIVPGSMGAASYLLAGQGNRLALNSASHGAGRSLSRGKSTHVSTTRFNQETKHLRIVGPIDPRSPLIARRPDILQKFEKRIMEEAPYAYKPIESAIDSIHEAGIAQRVARLWPLCTVKG